MNQNLANLSMDLRRASYFFQQDDVILAQKFVDRSQNYNVPEKIKSLISRINIGNNLHASEMAMTASIILGR